jgi:hypothetical protein
MTTIHVEPGKTIIIELENVGSLANRNKEIYDDIIECSAYVSQASVPTTSILQIF